MRIPLQSSLLWPLAAWSPLKTSASEHRNRHRRVLLWSLAGAALVHLIVFVALPDMEVEPLEGSNVRTVDLGSAEKTPSALLDVSFGPPEIANGNGTTHHEPAERVLNTKRLAELPPLCLELAAEGTRPLHGRVRLSVGPAGYAQVEELITSTGSTCGDFVIRNVAGSLRYHWLPDSRFPAPVDLVQPVTLVEVRR